MNQPTGPSFDPSKTTPLVCACGNHTFTTSVFLRKVSKLVSPNGQEGVLPVPTFVCNACGVPPDEAVPQFIKLEAKGLPPEPPQTILTTTANPTTMTKGRLSLV